MPTKQPTMKQTRLTPEEFNQIQTRVTLVHTIVVLAFATLVIIVLALGNWTLSKLIPTFSYKHSISMMLALVIYIVALVVYFADKNNMDVRISRWMLSNNIGTGLYSL